MNGFPLPRTGRQLSAQNTSSFSLQRLFFTKQICIFETTPHLPHLRLQAGLLISYYTAPLSICQVDFQNFFLIPSAPDKIRFDSAIF